MGEFSSSEDELENVENRPGPAPLRLDFINLYRLGLCDCLALSALPGCRCEASCCYSDIDKTKYFKLCLYLSYDPTKESQSSERGRLHIKLREC